jgi:hypothetical protein
MRKPSRTVYEGIKAYNFYAETTSKFSPDDKTVHGDRKYTGFGEEYTNIGGWWLEKPDVWIAYDFTDGDEVFIEEFDSKEEAQKYAAGIMALTRDGIEI